MVRCARMAAKRLSPLRLSLILIAALAAWASGGTLSVASAQPHASGIGVLPPAVWLVFAVAFITLLVWQRRLWPGARILALSALLLLPWLPLPVPAAAYVWAGHLTAWVWVLVAAALAAPVVWRRVPRSIASAARDPRRATWLAAGIATLAYCAGAHQVFPRLPAGDEPHYMVIAQSLLNDHDLRIENNHRQGDYRAYYVGDLKPDYLRRGTDGEIYSIHAPGLPVLVLPVFAVLGYSGVVAFLALLAGCGTALAWTAAWRITRDVGAAWFGWATVALSVPFFFQAFVVYPDAPGAVIVMLGALTMIEGRDASVRRLLATGAALAILPWLHMRLAVAAGVLGALILIRQIGAPAALRRAAALLVVPVISASCWLGFFYAIYGTPDPRAPYGGANQSGLSEVPRGLVGLAFDQQFGVLPNAPVYLCAAIGFIPLLRRHTRIALELAAVLVPYTVAVAAFQMWWGGYSSPARFLTPVLPLFAVPAASWFHASRARASFAFGLGGLAVSLLMTATIAAVDRGALLYNVRDGASRLMTWMSPLVDVTRGLPSLFHTGPLTALGHACVWLAAIALTAIVGAALAKCGAGRSTLATAIGLTAAVSGMAALSIVWRSNHATPITPFTGNVALLRAVDPGGRQIAIAYAPLRRMPLEAIPARIALATAAPMPGVDGPLARVLHLPAATYAVDAALSQPGAGHVTVTSDGGLGPLFAWDLADARHTWRREFHLPVDTAVLLVDGDAAARATIDHLSLHAVGVVPRRGRVSDEESWHAARYGSAIVFLMSGDAYMEPGGTWIAGGASATLVIAPDEADAPIHLFVRNPPIDNRVTLDSGAWHQEWSMKPGEERFVDIPMPRGRTSVPLRVSVARGARPVDFAPGSPDRRLLGCWIEPR